LANNKGFGIKIPMLLASCMLLAAHLHAEDRQLAARWLSDQLHHPVDAQQVLSAPSSALEGCMITSSRTTVTGSTELLLRCPFQQLPQLVLMRVAPGLAPSHEAATAVTVAAKPIVRRGSQLEADWRTPGMHAVLPVIAVDSGAEGAEIRVRVAHSTRIMRARIQGPHSAMILSAGV
jgi:hypothetical protein